MPEGQDAWGVSTSTPTQSDTGDGFLWPPWREGLPFQKTPTNYRGVGLSSLSGNVHQSFFLRFLGVWATPSLGFPTHIHQEWGGGKGHVSQAMGRTRWDFTCTADITSVTLESSFSVSDTDVPLMCAFNSSDLPLHIHFYTDFCQEGEGPIFLFYISLTWY